MTENSMHKVRTNPAIAKDSAYKSSAPLNYRPPTPVKVPLPPAKKAR